MTYDEAKQIAAKYNKHNAINNEGAEGYNPHSDMIADAREVISTTEYAAARADRITRKYADADAVNADRAIWNAAAKSGKYRTPAQIEKATGIDAAMLRDAKNYYGIN